MPRHGGADNGASGNGIIEKNLTLDISKYMYDRFKELGVPVKMTRTSDVDSIYVIPEYLCYSSTDLVNWIRTWRI